ncbi:hypothetical protein Tco_0745387 [Tanacetum coccineum]
MGRDTVQLETAVSTITQEYLLEFTSEYGISEDLHPELPDRGDRIVDFPEGKIGMYTKFFEFANFRVPISQFLFDILGHYQIHLSQLSVIGAAKVSHFEIQCRVLRLIPSVNLFRVFYIPSYSLGWISFSKRPGKNTPQCYTKPLDSLKNWNNRFFWVDERVFPTTVAWRTSAPKDSMPLEGTYSVEDVAILNARRTPIQKQPETLLCLVGLSRRYFLGDDVYPIFLHDDGRGGDGFVQSDQRSKSCRDQNRHPSSYYLRGATINGHREPTDRYGGAGHEIRGVGAEDQGPETMASVVPPAGPLLTTRAAPNIVEEEETAVDAPLVSKRRSKRANEESNVNSQRSSKGATAAGGPEPDPTSPIIVIGDGISVAQVARQDQRIQAMEGEKKNLETLLEAEADMRKAAEAKNAELVKEMESLRAQFTELQVSHDGLSHQVSTLQAQTDVCQRGVRRDHKRLLRWTEVWGGAGRGKVGLDDGQRL